jgi:hypothetical protein
MIIIDIAERFLQTNKSTSNVNSANGKTEGLKNMHMLLVNVVSTLIDIVIG